MEEEYIVRMVTSRGKSVINSGVDWSLEDARKCASELKEQFPNLTITVEKRITSYQVVE